MSGVSRDIPLWTETIESLEKIPKSGKLVFHTSEDGHEICSGYFHTNG